ncbi:MAG: hypothetical protein NTV70_14180 [Acidobacteria bacterium]|nr:hypothetical protein [Acidobacteriota bacterium]
MTIVLIAAEARELAGVLSRVPHSPTEGMPIRFVRVGQWGKHRLICAADGPGSELAGKAAEVALERFQPDLIWSVGLCGALDDALVAGEVLTATEVVHASSGARYPAGGSPASRRNGKKETGKPIVVVSQDRVASTADEKRGLRSLGAVVEMEAAAVARVALGAQVPFGCVKAVSDLASEGFQVDLNAARGSDGRFRTSHILWDALRKPLKGLPELWRLQGRSRQAAENLGEFIVNCSI